VVDLSGFAGAAATDLARPRAFAITRTGKIYLPRGQAAGGAEPRWSGKRCGGGGSKRRWRNPLAYETVW